MEDEQVISADVLELLRNSAQSRVRLAKSMLAAFEANAMPQPATPEDITYWENKLSGAELALAKLHDTNRT